jgi:hypothetical protein
VSGVSEVTGAVHCCDKLDAGSSAADLIRIFARGQLPIGSVGFECGRQSALNREDQVGWENSFSLPDPPNEVTWALGRLPHRTYIARSFTLNFPASQDHGQPARYVTKVFDELPDEESPAIDTETTSEEYIVATSPGGRKQIKLQVVREAGNVRQLL